MVSDIVVIRCGARQLLGITGGVLCKVHYAVHLKLVQNSIKYKL